MKNTILIALCALFVCCKGTAPAPYGATPTPEQVEWQKLEYYMFAHFGPNTFTDKEWGDGKEDPKVFLPTSLDCRQWASIAKQAGMKGIILTAKHHDGFCLWPSAQSKHTVRESNWKGGQGDVLAELSEACRQEGIGFGIYVSPWDRNHPLYGTPEYNQVFANTLREVLTGYGPVFEQWLDGANGEGENGKLQIYDWPLFNTTIAEAQPGIVTFSDVGPGCRWIGNEDGIAGQTMWSRLDIEGFEPGGKNSPGVDTLNHGNIFGAAWVPGEADVSIRPGWFYSPATDDKVKTTAELMTIYYGSVGRNANLLLNVPIDRRGMIHPADSAALMQFRKAREEALGVDLAAGAKVEASSNRGCDFGAGKLTDGDYETYWATRDGVLTGSFEVILPEATTFNRIMLQEYIPLGQRVSGFRVSCMDDSSGQWKEIATATTIGYKRILCFDSVTSKQVKVEITSSLACPVINTVSVFNAPEL